MGRPGADGVTIEEIVDKGQEAAMIGRLAAQLRAKTYRFQPVRRVDIPKPKGGTRPLGIAGREGTGQCQGAPALRRREMSVPRGEREAVGVPHGRQGAQFELERQVGDHPSQDGDLLGVFLAEVRPCGPDDVEELEADRGDAAEVPRPELAF